MLDPAILFGDELNRSVSLDEGNGIVTIESDDAHDALRLARKVNEYLTGINWTEVIVSSERSLTFTGSIDIFQPWKMIIKGFPFCGMVDHATHDTGVFLTEFLPGRLPMTLERIVEILSMPRDGNPNNWNSTAYKFAILPPQ